MIPAKPFGSYKWRWLSVAPTESLLDPPVLLGVLRVLARHEGKSTAHPVVLRELGVVQRETGTPVNLVRSGERNLIRNSGQYWKGLGLIQPSRGVIALTPLGRRVASGGVTQSEFAAMMIEETVLPNPWTYTAGEIDNWRGAGLEIRPLVLLLEVVSALKAGVGVDDGYLSPGELVNVVIPLAGQKFSAGMIADYVLRYRRNKRVVFGWPDCAEGANDERLAREFLLFLANFGALRGVIGGPRADEKYWLDEGFDVQSLGRVRGGSIFTTNEVEQVSVIGRLVDSDLPTMIERQKVAAMVWRRPQQPKFREDVLKAYSGRCLLSDEVVPSVLEAAHIIPVKNSGADLVSNGFCLRVDIHRLFDAGNIRIDPNGNVEVKGVASASASYRMLLRQIEIPGFVSLANLEWRYNYL